MEIFAVVLMVLLIMVFLISVFLAIRLSKDEKHTTFPFYHSSRNAGSEILAFQRLRENSLEESSLQTLPAPYQDHFQLTPAVQIALPFSYDLPSSEDTNMETIIDAQKQLAMAAHVQTVDAARELLARYGFTSTEVVALLQLQQWYQTGGSDRVIVLHHWEFLRFLVRAGKLEM